MTHRLQRLRHNSKRYYLLIGALVLLAGCSSLSAPHVSAARKANHAYTLTVDLSSADTPAGIAARYNGDVLVWEPGVYALIGTDTPSLQPQAAK